MIKIKKLANALNSMVVPLHPSQEGNLQTAPAPKLPSSEGIKGWVLCHDCERLFDGIFCK